jgi:hypothetical protein
MLQPLGDHPEGECLNAGDGFIPIGAVAQHARKSGHFGEPAAVVFAFQLDGERHARTVPSGPAVSNKPRQPPSGEDPAQPNQSD